MALSDCVDCWETPCTCGTGYKHWDIKKIQNLIEVLKKVIEEKKKK
jgi:hypothetical protein